MTTKLDPADVRRALATPDAAITAEQLAVLRTAAEDTSRSRRRWSARSPSCGPTRLSTVCPSSRLRLGLSRDDDQLVARVSCRCGPTG